MAQPKNIQRQFADQQDALTVYLNDLLSVSESNEKNDEDNSLPQSETEVITALNTDSEGNTGSNVETDAKINPANTANDTGTADSFATDDVTSSQAALTSLATGRLGVQSSDPISKPFSIVSGFEQISEQQGAELHPVLLPQSFLDSEPSASESPSPQIALADHAQTPDQPQPEREVVVIPDWAKTRFQCLTFTVGDYAIAAPLEKLNGIIQWPEHITALPGRAKWFLGLYRTRGQNVQVIDLEAILSGTHGLFPHSQKHDKPDTRQSPRYILLVDDGRMGFASDTVANMLTLEPAQVKWNSNKQRQSIDQKQFVIGTVLEKMCSILDVDVLVEELYQR